MVFICHIKIKVLTLVHVKSTLNSSYFTNNARVLTNTKSSDYNLIVHSPWGEWLYKIKPLFSTIGWKGNVIRRLNDKMDYALKKMNEMGYALKKMNDAIAKA